MNLPNIFLKLIRPYCIKLQLILNGTSSEPNTAGGEFDPNQVDDGEWHDWSRKIGPDSTSANLGKTYFKTLFK